MYTCDNQKTEDLINAFLALRTAKEFEMFLCDLLTEKEILELGNRWKAAQMLDAQIPYVQIVKETGLSSTTIARISKWMKGGMGGYKLILNRISKDQHTAHSKRRRC